MSLRYLMIVPLLLAACGGGPKLQGTDAIDQTYTVAGGKFDAGGTVLVAAAARDFGGRLAICGARLQDKINSSIPGAEEAVLLSSYVTVNGDTVMRDLRNLSRLSLGDNLTGRPAKCFVTGDRWPGGSPEVAVRLPRHQDRSNRQRVVTFMPSDEVPLVIQPPQPTAPVPEQQPSPGQWQRSSS
ncbi:MAG: hypothetical protein AAF557_04230 [Pseudomonadota bacterium]